MTGFDRADDRPRAPRRSRRATSGVDARLLDAAELDARRPGPAELAAVADHPLLEGDAVDRTCATGSSVIGSTRRADAVARAIERRDRPVSRSPRASRARAVAAQREVLVAEVEPDVLAGCAQLVHHRERVAREAPAALVDAVGEPEGHEVRVGGDVAAVDLDVVAGVGDHDEVARRRRRAGRARASRRPVPPASTTTGAPIGRTVDFAGDETSSPRSRSSVRIREVGPRDGFQNEPEVIATDDKVAPDRPPRAHRPRAPRGHELRARRRDPAARRRPARCSPRSTSPTTSRCPC